MTDTSDGPDVTVVVMAYNETSTIDAVVEEIEATLTSMDRSYEILIVDDGSTDGTEKAAGRLAVTKACVRAVHHATNQGLGGVYRTGFAEARGSFVTFIPADGQYPAKIIGDFAPLMEGVDMVLGYVPNRRGSILAKTLSIGERVLYRLLFGRIPRFQGMLMFRRQLLRDVELKSDGRGWTVLMEFIIRVSRGGYRIVNAPTGLRPRMTGHSKVNNWSTIVANLRQTVALRRHL